MSKKRRPQFRSNLPPDGEQAPSPQQPTGRDLPRWAKRLLWGLVTAALVAPAFILGKSWRGDPWNWHEAAGAAAVMFIVFLFLATVRDYQR